MKNTKIQKHRLAGGFNPSAYTYVDQFDHRQNEVMGSQSGSYGEAHDPIDSAYNDELEANGYDCDHCTHCGSRLLNGSLYRHVSGELVVIGHTCVSRLSFNTADEIQRAHRENRIQQRIASRNHERKLEMAHRRRVLAAERRKKRYHL